MLEYLIPLILTCLIVSGTPGPNNIMLTASGRNFGFVKTIPHALGIVTGVQLLIISLSLGLIVLFNEYPYIQEILKFIGSCYLVYLAYRIYTSNLSDDNNTPKPITFIESLLFQFVNPKGVMMAISIISIYSNFENFIFIDSYKAGVILILLSCLVTNLFSVIFWTLIGIFLENLIKSSKAIKIFNISMSSLLVLTIGLIYLDI